MDTQSKKETCNDTKIPIVTSIQTHNFTHLSTIKKLTFHNPKMAMLNYLPSPAIVYIISCARTLGNSQRQLFLLSCALASCHKSQQ